MIELTEEMVLAFDRAMTDVCLEESETRAGLAAVFAIVERDYRLVRRPAKPASKQRGHLWQEDPDAPGCCRRCHLPGEPGDSHHTLPDVPEQAEVAARYEPDGGDS